MNRQTLTHHFYMFNERFYFLTARLFGYDMPRRPDVALPMEGHGNGTAEYFLDGTGLGPESIIYSFGVGGDVSFDCSVIARYGAQVWAFDPTPQSKAFVESSRLPDRFHFLQYALGPVDGEMSFSHIVTEHPESLQGTLVDLGSRKCGAGSVPVHKLETIMTKLGHDHIDVLKIDVSGGEYEILDDLLRLAPRVPQLLIELHPNMLNWQRYPTVLGRYGWRETRKFIDRLRAAGYLLTHVSERGVDFSFKRAAD